MYTIEKKFMFEAAHLLNLDDETHPCSVLHGHSYKVFIKIETEKLDKNGFIIDFGKLKEFKKYIIDEMDHSIILTEDQIVKHKNLIIDCQKIFTLPSSYENTTAECMCEYLNTIVHEYLVVQHNFLKKCKITVTMYETENNSASYTREYTSEEILV